MKSLIIIPARKGSTRILNKNIRTVHGKPLIYWTIKYAKIFKRNFDICVSSDCKKIETITKKLNVNFILRKQKLSSSKAHIYDVINDILKKTKKKYDFIILLAPTSPLREKNLIKKGLKLLQINKKNFDALIHVAKVNSTTGSVKNNLWKPDNSINTRTQDITNKYMTTGNLFIYKKIFFEKKNFKKNKKIYAFKTDSKNWVNIDYEKDFAVLKDILKRKNYFKSYN